MDLSEKVQNSTIMKSKLISYGYCELELSPPRRKVTILARRWLSCDSRSGKENGDEASSRGLIARLVELVLIEIVCDEKAM